MCFLLAYCYQEQCSRFCIPNPVDAPQIWWNIICTFGLFSKIGKNNPDFPKNEKNHLSACGESPGMNASAKKHSLVC